MPPTGVPLPNWVPVPARNGFSCHHFSLPLSVMHTSPLSVYITWYPKKDINPKKTHKPKNNHKPKGKTLSQRINIKTLTPCAHAISDHPPYLPSFSLAPLQAMGCCQAGYQIKPWPHPLYTLLLWFVPRLPYSTQGPHLQHAGRWVWLCFPLFSRGTSTSLSHCPILSCSLDWGQSSLGSSSHSLHPHCHHWNCHFHC